MKKVRGKDGKKQTNFRCKQTPQGPPKRGDDTVKFKDWLKTGQKGFVKRAEHLS